MKRTAALAALALTVALAAGMAQHHEAVAGKPAGENAAAEGHGSGGGHGSEGSLEIWKWANFALLAGALGWVIRKNAGPYFETRSREIRKQLVEAEEIRAEADRRASEVEAKLARLGTEIDALKREALAEQEAAGERFESQTKAEMAKVEAQAEQEIDAAGKHARQELKAYAAGLAVELAESKIRARMTPAVQEGLVDSFVRNLEPPAGRVQGV